MKILLVDDNAFTRYIIKTLLRELGHEVAAEAETGAEAVKSFAELKPDVVFLDLILPGKFGIGVLEDLQNVNPRVRVVVITAVGQDETDRQLSDKGVYAILRKPFSLEDFKTVMEGMS